MNRAFIVAVRDEVNHIHEIHGHPVLFCGVGKVNATIGVQELRTKGATEIVNIGSCGSTRHSVGEILRIGKVFQDIDCSPICPYGQTAFEEESAYIIFDPSTEHTCFTTDYFYDHNQEAKYSPHYLDMIRRCSVFDMELFAIAKTCRHYNIPLTAYKWVSDDGDFQQWMQNCEVSSKKVIEMLFA